jgi:hypothetical protein
LPIIDRASTSAPSRQRRADRVTLRLRSGTPRSPERELAVRDVDLPAAELTA